MKEWEEEMKGSFEESAGGCDERLKVHFFELLKFRGNLRNVNRVEGGGLD